MFKAHRDLVGGTQDSPFLTNAAGGGPHFEGQRAAESSLLCFAGL